MKQLIKMIKQLVVFLLIHKNTLYAKTSLKNLKYETTD